MPANQAIQTMDHNAPVFPVPVGATGVGISYYDWLAAVALQALTTRGLEVKADRAMTDEERDFELATRAYRMADAMLRARAKAHANLAKRDATPSKSDAHPAKPAARP
jgi:hypothetical protein